MDSGLPEIVNCSCLFYLYIICQMSFDGEGIVTKMNQHGKLKWDKFPVNY